MFLRRMFLHRPWIALTLLAGLLLVFPPIQRPAAAEEPLVDQVQAADAATTADATEAVAPYLRVVRDQRERPLRLETSIRTFERTADASGSNGAAQTVRVDLVSVIHIGEREYYEQLNEQFDDYDVVLYELVAPEGTRVPSGGGERNLHPVSLLQGGMQNMLGLDSQLACIDYQKPHLVHADMTPEEMNESIAKRGEDPLSMFFRMFGYSLAQQARNPRAANDADLLMALLDRQNRTWRMRQLMADQFESVGGGLPIFDGPEGSTLVTERNKVALEALAAQIAAGKRRIGIFYGAGHMPDFQRRLTGEEWGFEPRRDKWLFAWELRAPDDRPGDGE